MGIFDEINSENNSLKKVEEAKKKLGNKAVLQEKKPFVKPVPPKYTTNKIYSGNYKKKSIENFDVEYLEKLEKIKELRYELGHENTNFSKFVLEAAKIAIDKELRKLKKLKKIKQ